MRLDPYPYSKYTSKFRLYIRGDNVSNVLYFFWVWVRASTDQAMDIGKSNKLLADDALGPWPRLSVDSLVVAAGDTHVQVALPPEAALDTKGSD